MPVVFCDVDGGLRRQKGVRISSEIRQAVTSFNEDLGIFYMITGAPLEHVPDLPAWRIFAEAGGVYVRKQDHIFEPGREAVLELRRRLEIFQEDGVVETSWGSVIVEGPKRFTSLTLLFGRPPHYPGAVTSADMEEVNAWIGEFARELSLTLSVGHDTTYSYSDIFSVTKRQTVAAVMEEERLLHAYFLGDKHPDLEAMLVPGIIPVGFSNSIKDIQVLAQRKGVYIDLPGPEGGVVEFFRLLKEGKI